MANLLIHESSPYLLQHANNPVNWYPWGEEAFQQARLQDKPVFLSIGYSTCHWCHVMAHESFEDAQVASILNRGFISIKVDKEERPDIDSIYMSVCQAVTGSGGWPLSLFLTWEKKPFFAGTYFPKRRRYGSPGFIDLLQAIQGQWLQERGKLLRSASKLVTQLRQNNTMIQGNAEDSQLLTEHAFRALERGFDADFGGFGAAPKFPSPHNLLFLMHYAQISGNPDGLTMSEKTLQSMYHGGIFDQIGFGFSRYSTDSQWLVPHFEKMLYDNALLILAYTQCYSFTKNSLYQEAAARTITYVLRELQHPQGGFFSAQDADSEGEEGKYYVFTPQELEAVLGREQAALFCTHFGFSSQGNFEGKNIPNLLHRPAPDTRLEPLREKVLRYRRTRYALHRDDKVLTAWNALMIAALCSAYEQFQTEDYLTQAKRALEFLETNLFESGRLCTSWRANRRSGAGYLEDYAFLIYAYLASYRVTLDAQALEKAIRLAERTLSLFADKEGGGFFLYGTHSESFFLRPKEVYDGAIPSGNSVMLRNLHTLSLLTGSRRFFEETEKQLAFLTRETAGYPGGCCFFLDVWLDILYPQKKIIAVLNGQDSMDEIRKELPSDALVAVYPRETPEYPLKNGKTTFYVCENGICLPPENTIRQS